MENIKKNCEELITESDIVITVSNFEEGLWEARVVRSRIFSDPCVCTGETVQGVLNFLMKKVARLT